MEGKFENQANSQPFTVLLQNITIVIMKVLTFHANVFAGLSLSASLWKAVCAYLSLLLFLYMCVNLSVCPAPTPTPPSLSLSLPLSLFRMFTRHGTGMFVVFFRVLHFHKSTNREMKERGEQSSRHISGEAEIFPVIICT